MKCSVYIATSTDGFIAKTDGNIEWLTRPEYQDAARLGLTYNDFISTVDAIVMGRHTFEKVLSFDEWHYGYTEVIVLTTRDLRLPETLAGKARVRFKSGSPDAITAMLSEEGKKHLYIDGGITIQRFLDAGLIHELTITEIPILLGNGIPLFGNETVEQKLELLDVVASPGGTIQKRYKVKPVE
ncbi:dihydrofolate reductase family protein [Rhodohalobacter mucosus]|uniref:Deaminase n=1 Tax=Rhodohalobacter mucosus TaxID=2079485 RepID=A0A316TR88_9BACT|nr:dihydrofolate reductase family protein [Rhodohalobacter mucosus]PWN06328.1 deaminase [Rhodohalobacter mucosus]